MIEQLWDFSNDRPMLHVLFLNCVWTPEKQERGLWHPASAACRRQPSQRPRFDLLWSHVVSHCGTVRLGPRGTSMASLSPPVPARYLLEPGPGGIEDSVAGMSMTWRLGKEASQPKCLKWNSSSKSKTVHFVGSQCYTHSAMPKGSERRKFPIKTSSNSLTH